MPTLRVIYRSSVFQGRALILHDDVIKLGRDPRCQILFDEVADRTVSRNHAEIRWETAGPVLHPTPGRVVLLHQQPVTGPTLLKTGEVIELAGVGGPSVEVIFDPVAAPTLALNDVDASAQTMLDMSLSAVLSQQSRQATGTPQAIPPPLVRPPALSPPAAPRTASATAGGRIPVAPKAATSASSAAVPPPASESPAAAPADGKAQRGTEFLAPVELAAFASEDAAAAPPPPKVRSRAAAMRTAAIGGVLLACGAAGVGLYLHHARQERIRMAVQRVEALLAAEESSGVAPDVSEEDIRLFEEEVKANRHAPAPIPLRVPHRGHAGEHATRATHEAAPAEKEGAPTDDAKRTAVRTAFAAYQRAQIARLSAGAPRDRSGKETLKALAAEVKKAEEAYEEAAKALPPQKSSDVELLLRKTLRQLGECDALAPPKFLAQAKETVEKMRTDPGWRERLSSAMKRAADYRYGPTITAALADQGLPVELFFIPYQMSGFDEKRVDLPSAGGIPKGMWGLLPGPAEEMGLKLGKASQSLDPDPTDEREHYEREVKKVARAFREVFLKKAAGSTLLFMATYDRGDSVLLLSTKKKAGLSAQDSDPETVNFWRVYEKGLTDDMRRTALEYVAVTAICQRPDQFGFSFAPPLEHVALAESE